MSGYRSDWGHFYIKGIMLIFAFDPNLNSTGICVADRKLPLPSNVLEKITETRNLQVMEDILYYKTEILEKSYNDKHKSWKSIRGEFRRNRRKLHRKQHRITKLNRLFEDQKWIGYQNIPKKFRHLLFINEENGIYEKALKRLNLKIKPTHIPYFLRNYGLDNKLELEEFASILLLIGKRRGWENWFSEEDNDSEISKVTGIVSKSIQDIRDKMNSSNSRTIGEFLFKKLEKEGTSRGKNRKYIDEETGEVIETKDIVYTHRDMFKDEFNLLWDKQTEFHKSELTPELKQKIFNIIFDEKGMNFDKVKAQLGHCTYEKSPVAPKCLPTIELYELISNLKNIRYDDSKYLTDYQIDDIIKSIYISNTINTRKITWNTIKEISKIPKQCEWNLKEIYPKGIPSINTFLSLKDVLGSDIHNFFNIKKPNNNDLFDGLRNLDILTTQIYFNCGTRDKNKPKIVKRVLKAFPEFSINKIHDLLKVKLSPYNSSISRKAASKTISRLLNGCNNSNIAFIELYPTEYLNGKLTKDILIKGLKQFKKRVDITNWIKNPISKQVISHILKRICELTEIYGIPDRINIENTRDIGTPMKDINNLYLEQSKNSKKNKLCDCELTKLEISVNENNRTKIKCLMESNDRCVYCNRELTFNETEIDHIYPKSRYIDNSHANLVASCVSCNRNKDNKLAIEVFGTEFINTLSQNITHSKYYDFKFPNSKIHRLLKNSLPEDFLNKDLMAIGVVSKKVSEILKTIGYTNIITSSGVVTSKIRNLIGIPKNRYNLLHHATDAYFISFIDDNTWRNVNSKDYLTDQQKKDILGIPTNSRDKLLVLDKDENVTFKVLKKPSGNKASLHNQQPVSTKGKSKYNVKNLLSSGIGTKIKDNLYPFENNMCAVTYLDSKNKQQTEVISVYDFKSNHDGKETILKINFDKMGKSITGIYYQNQLVSINNEIYIIKSFDKFHNSIKFEKNYRFINKEKSIKNQDTKTIKIPKLYGKV